MTKLEIITINKKLYNDQLEKNKSLTGLSKLVGETLTLEWIKGNNWLGGLSDSKANKLYSKLMKMGYDFDEIDDEFQSQIDELMPLTEGAMQYYGVDEDGKTSYVAMSKEEVIQFAKKHPEENIVRVEDKFGHGFKLTEDYESDLEKIKEIFYELETYLESTNIWIDDYDYSGENKTISVYIDQGDWKHDHWRLDYLLDEWFTNRGIEYSVSHDIEPSDSDCYSAWHIFRIKGLNESLSQLNEEKFTNGSVVDFNPEELMEKVMSTGQSLHTIRFWGDDIYYISVFYQDYFGPKGDDDLDTKYWVDIVKEDDFGNQERINIDGRNLTYTEVIDILNNWKNDLLHRGI